MKAAEGSSVTPTMKMDLQTELYVKQSARWPTSGRHILAQYDADTVVVYQAYNPAIGGYAIKDKVFGGDFSYARMSWVKPNFLWMMYRSGWATKDGQQTVLGLRISRKFFDDLLDQAVPSSFDPSAYQNQEEWKRAVETSSVRLQWDPDHAPDGAPLERRAIQLGLRGSLLERFGKSELLDVIDMTDFVAEQRAHLRSGELDRLETPLENVYAANPIRESRSASDGSGVAGL